MRKEKPARKPQKHYKRYEKREQPKSALQQLGSIILEWDKGTLVYARQSTINQRLTNLAAAEIETKKLLEFAYQSGAPRDERTILYDENEITGRLRSASGTLRIDEREGLSALCERIENDEGKVVVVHMVDRLFRDETLIGPVTFMDLCRKHNVKVVLLSGMIYDFEYESFRMQFILESMSAAAYLRMMKERLHRGKMIVSHWGKYDGRAVPAGFLVDRRKFLPDGTPNPGYKRYMVYEPHARVVRWLFRRFYELSGDLMALCREVAATNDGYIFPPLPPETDPMNVRKLMLGERDENRRRVVPDERGYRISKTGIISILTNSDYIGEWHSEGETIPNNHPAIVSRDLFDFAQSILQTPRSDRVITSRKRKSATVGCLDGIITSPVGPVYLSPYPKQDKTLYEYAAYELNYLSGHQRRYSISAPYLDNLVVKRVIMHFGHSSPGEFVEKWRNDAVAHQRKKDARKKQIQGQLRQTEKQLDEIAETIGKLKLPVLIERKEQEYANLLQRKAELEQALRQPVQEPKAATVYRLRNVLARARAEWDALPLERQRELLSALIVKLHLSLVAPHWMRLDIEWLDPEWGAQTFYIYRLLVPRYNWSENDDAWLREQYVQTSHDEIMAHFPTRNWQGIRNRARDLRLFRPTNHEHGSIPAPWSVDDWNFLEAHPELKERIEEGDVAMDNKAYSFAS